MGTSNGTIQGKHYIKSVQDQNFWHYIYHRESRVIGFDLMISQWSALDKEESLACQITSTFNNKLAYFHNY